MESFCTLQEDIRDKMLKAKSNFKKSPKDRLTDAYFETRLENLEQLWKSFTATHKEILTSIKKAELTNSSYIKNNLYDEVEEFYVEFKCELKELLTKNTTDSWADAKSSSCHSDKVVSKVKLPEIKIPSFSGKYSEWQTFRDLFIGLVHENQSLDDAQRFYYLKGHLSGEAEQLIRNMQVTADNYKTAWSKLDKMYNNKKFLANGIIKRLLGQKSLTCESAVEIKRLVTTTSECLESIANLGVDPWNLTVIHIISGKLNKETKKCWELKVASDSSDELPTFDQFAEFLTSRFRGLENLDKTDRLPHPHPKGTQSFHVYKDKKNVSCAFCSADHRITVCAKFCKESNEARRAFVQGNNLCFVCLNSNHSAKHCRNTLRCQVCKRRHHSLLHPTGASGSVVGEDSNGAHAETSSAVGKVMKEVNNKSNVEIAAQAEGPSSPLVTCLSTGSGRKTVLLTTALIKAESKDGTYRVLRALLDQGSQGSFVTESTVQFLGLNKTPSRQTVIGVGGDKSAMAKATVVLKVRSRIDPTVQISVNAFVLKSVTAFLPATKVARVEWVDLTDDDLADPEYYRPNKIDVLLGAEVYSQVIQEGIKRDVSGTLLAQDTTLGWILSGTLDVDRTSHPSHITVMHTSFEDDDLLKRFWELEAEPSGKKMLTEEEKKCENIFTATTERDKSGRYVVRLPLRYEEPVSKVGESKSIAEKRLRSLESKFKKNSKFKEDYSRVLEEYLELKHMRKVPEEERSNQKAIYLPHHAVIREDKETSKVRIVFDASCKGSKGMSLNDNLLVGPTLQSELRHTIMRWRTHRICLVADIIKMYRQVLVNRKDVMLQRILWRDSPEKQIKEYELETVTFGTASAPYLAVRALQQIAQDECLDQPETAKIIVNDFYMDDLMTGAENIETCLNIYAELTKVLSKGGFILQKWRSNSHELLIKMKDEINTTDDDLKIKMDSVTKILGLTWNSIEDFFQYSVELQPLVTPVTKRKIISEISRLFDPLGWLAPSIILAKIFIQKLWLAGLEWDQEIPNNLVQEWVTYHRDLVFLVNIKIPRWLHLESNNVKMELHGFSDASKMAYSAVIYIRIVDHKQNIHIYLVTSKTRVAPIRQVSIPRLELCGAVLLAKLMVEVGQVLNIPKTNWHAWTDSEVVLAWLNSHPSRWKTFVANRVSDILNTLDTQYWSHVSSKQNPADCASRGVSPAELESTTLWWKGPDYLRQQVVEYKKPKHLVTHLEEVKVHTIIFDIAFWNKFSTLSRLIRVIAYCRRFLNLRKNQNTRIDTGSQYLSTQELKEATEICVKKCQEEGCTNELEELKNNKIENKNGKLKSLNLFIDSKGIIRVGGRLEMSQLSYERVHPILIPKNSFLTPLLIADAHYKTMHGGPQLMVTYLRSRYWIIGVKLLAKKYVRDCIRCIRYTARVRTQLMGQLPSSRVTVNKPFLCSGVDYAGPINIRVSKGRGNKSYKGYIALFICLATRAVHLEAVSELSTKGFLAAFKRFVARRGRCAEIHSDNGTNFVGAARELLYLFNKEKSSCNPELAEELANNGTQWHFIPPHSPNFGGLWEAGFKIGVRHLQMMYMLASSITMGFIRGSMGVAVLAVNDQTRRDDTYIQIYNWDGKIQGAVLSSFFFGYALMLMPSEIYLKRIGGKLLTTVMLLINGVLCVAMPTIINKGGWVAACNAKLFMGMTHACFFTVNQSLFEQWLPPNERRIFNHIVYGGVQIGIIIALPVSGLLSSAPLGWELVYYSLAMLALSMAIISGTLTASSPGEHQAVGDAEKEFIRDTLSSYRKKDISRPWRDILKSSHFWAVTVAHATSNALFIFFITFVPAYLMTFGMSLEDSAWYSMLPFIAMASVYIIMSPIIDWVYTIKYIHYIFSASFYRKVINALGAFGIVMGLTTLPNFPREWGCPAVIVLTAILGLLGLQFCGYLSTYEDMSENYSGTLMMISCTVSSGFGVTVPFVSGLILGNDMCNQESWRVIMLTLGSLYIVSTVIYTTCGSNDRQNWDHVTNNNKRRLGQYNGVINCPRAVQLEEYGHINLALQRHDIDTAL